MVILLLVLLGLAFGSFITALTWRLHEKKNFVNARSQCEYCGHKLGVLDLIPVISWLALGGRCRYCKKPIGWHNPVLEVSVAALFVASYTWWPTVLNDWLAWASFGLWLVYIVALVALIVYDIRWMLLPDVIVWPLVVLALGDAALRVMQGTGPSLQAYVSHVVLGGLTLGGFYWMLHTVSRGNWVGFGDVKLGLFIGIVLGWQQALLALFIANFVGLLVVLPGLVGGKLSVRARVPFGPFLIVGFLLSGLFGERIIAAYVGLLLGQSL